MYEYKAQYRENYDGDTVRFDIDLGFGVWMKNQVVRLYGVNTPELRGDSLEEGRKAKKRVFDSLSNANEIILKTHKDKKGKYGRWLAEVFVDGQNLNKQLVEEGFAVEYLL